MQRSIAFGSGFLASFFLLAALCPGGQVPTSPTSESRGTPPRATPADYQVHAQAGAITIAAEFAGHSVPTLENTYTTEDYIVVETAFFGGEQGRLKLSIEDFSLRINDKKSPLTSQPFGLVAKTLKDPEWQPPVQEKEKSKTSLNGGGGGDSSPAPPPKMPIELRRAMDLKVQKAVLPEGDRALPVAGLIFFQHRGKTQNIHNMELVYSGPAGNANLALQP
jgi:hypothetical protein